jgi:hypothetical protein
MHPDAEIDVPMNAVASMAMKFSAVGGGAKRESLQQRAARTLQAILNRCETGDDRLNNDLVRVVAVTSQNDGTVTAEILTHDDPDLLKRSRRGA